MAASQGEHAKLPSGTLVNNRYMIIKEVGCGNFSKVYKCKDTLHGSDSMVALKVLKREYANDAAFENDMFKVMNNKDSEKKAKVCRMIEHFTWNRYPCFVMPLRGPSLRTRKFGLASGRVAKLELARFVKEMLETLKFLHFDCRVVHTDLKPENILLDDDSSETGLGNGWTICDFGSASLWRNEKMDSDLISTRPYRAPEVVMGNPWSYPADTWSMGCIFYEAASGSRLFEVHDDFVHLNRMEQRLGKLPEVFTHNSKHSKKYFDSKGCLLRGPPPSRTGSASSTPRPMIEVLKEEPLLFDLINSMLHYDPLKRIRADTALKHPYFNCLKEEAPAQAKRTSSASNDRDSASQSPASRFRALPPLISAVAALKLEAGDVHAASHLAPTVAAPPSSSVSPSSSAPSNKPVTSLQAVVPQATNGPRKAVPPLQPVTNNRQSGVLTKQPSQPQLMQKGVVAALVAAGKPTGVHYPYRPLRN